MMFLPILLTIVAYVASFALGMMDGTSYFDVSQSTSAGNQLSSVDIHDAIMVLNSTWDAVVSMSVKAGDETKNPAIPSIEVVWVVPRVFYSDDPSRNHGLPSSLMSMGCGVWSSDPGKNSGNANEKCYVWGPQLNMFYSLNVVQQNTTWMRFTWGAAVWVSNAAQINSLDVHPGEYLAVKLHVTSATTANFSITNLRTGAEVSQSLDIGDSDQRLCQGTMGDMMGCAVTLRDKDQLGVPEVEGLYMNNLKVTGADGKERSLPDANPLYLVTLVRDEKTLFWPGLLSNTNFGFASDF